MQESDLLFPAKTGGYRTSTALTKPFDDVCRVMGLKKKVGPVYYDHQAEHPFLGQRVALDGATSAATAAAIEEEARKILGHALEQASALLDKHRPELDRLCAALLERESLEREDIAALLGPAPAGGARVAAS